MPLRLRDDLHWCSCLDRVVFLDVAADRYFCLPSILNHAFLRLACGESQAGNSSQFAVLRERGILIDDPDAPPILPSVLIEAVTGDYATEQYPRTDLLSIICALASEMRLSWSLRRRPLRQIIEIARQRHPKWWPIARNPGRSLNAIVAASNKSALLSRAHDRCLVRAFAVHAACKRRGINAKLVFGVIANPFAAHCWVQIGTAVLVGGFEQARLYTPILVVE